jgi:hypothetical protein
VIVSFLVVILGIPRAYFWSEILVGKIVPEFGMKRGLVAEMQVGVLSGHRSRFIS